MKKMVLNLLLINVSTVVVAEPNYCQRHRNLAKVSGYLYDTEKLQTIFDNKQDRTYILSYPRSGNTWMRYCLEWLTKRPSFNRFNLKHHVNLPLGWTSGFEIDITKPGLEKVHTEIELKRTDAKDEHESLIFIVRNPKEVLVRHMGKNNLMEAMVKQPTPEQFQIYFDALKIFDEWRSPRKILIYYEDFMQHPKETLSSLLDFLHEPADLLPVFMDSYEMHKKKSLQVYGNSKSKGDDVLFHSKSLTAQEKQEIDAWVEQKEPSMWEKFLKDRYAESN